MATPPRTGRIWIHQVKLARLAASERGRVRAKSWSFEILARASDRVPAMIATAGYCCTYQRCSRQSPYFPPKPVGAPCPSLLPGSQLPRNLASTRYFLHDAHSPWEWRTTNKQPRERYFLRNGSISKFFDLNHISELKSIEMEVICGR